MPAAVRIAMLHHTFFAITRLFKKDDDHGTPVALVAIASRYCCCRRE
jgi:hypothetical protein